VFTQKEVLNASAYCRAEGKGTGSTGGKGRYWAGALGVGQIRGCCCGGDTDDKGRDEHSYTGHRSTEKRFLSCAAHEPSPSWINTN